MMRKHQAMLHHAVVSAACVLPRGRGHGLLCRLRSWLARPSASTRDRAGAPAASPERTLRLVHSTPVVPFPGRARGLLLRLVRDLEYAGTAASYGDDPVLLKLAAGPEQRLLIDSTAYVDVRPDPLSYRVVLGDRLTTRITLETTDYAEARSFIAQYLVLTRERTSMTGGAA